MIFIVHYPDKIRRYDDLIDTDYNKHQLRKSLPRRWEDTITTTPIMKIVKTIEYWIKNKINSYAYFIRIKENWCVKKIFTIENGLQYYLLP